MRSQPQALLAPEAGLEPATSGLTERPRGNEKVPEQEIPVTCDTNGSGVARPDSPLTHPVGFDAATFGAALSVLSEANDAEGIRLLLEERKRFREARAGNIVSLRPPKRDER